ncbi:sugar phosphate isomerase/epimerase family protein [Sinorhizobium meliloti]|uniref:sugar phosphate isomerase/epimerase family protein n=1 Tax=Rhizobium meliloti TaxID=382 RepID=UPI0023801440|nr:sugar phosphate isomerase/epimerase [Sinorhizobium meliloti]MDE3819670.1 sugar phosphate isomerase/epimerase [Sinorhizobium meliloti]MDW9984240.1 TIM barrel protein [Sinorhizobium meliloti]MDX0269925.1 TIM barrel protein [Sinorhizobium meliloti]
MTHLAMGYLTLGDLDPFDMVEAAGAGGFRWSGIRLTGHRPGDAWPFNPASDADIRRMLATMHAADVRLANVCTYRFTANIEPQAYLPVVAACAKLGVGTMICNSFETDEEMLAGKLAAVADLAAPLDIKLAFEFIPVSAVKTLGQALRIVEATGRDNVGIVVDALHLWRSGGSPQEVANAPANRMFALQLCDGPLTSPDDLYAEMRSARLMPGEGEFDLAGLMRAMPAHAEVEAEVPNFSHVGLPPAQFARLARQKTESFLQSIQAEAVR